MPTATRITALAAAMLCAILTAGCVGETPAPEPSPEPTSTPVFASEEEALAAATEAYKEYLAVSDAISAAGGDHAERIEKFVSPDRSSAEVDAFTALKSTGNRTTGESAFDSLRLQQFDPSLTIGEIFTGYLCLDSSGIAVLSEEGEDVTPSDRIEQAPLVVDFLVAPANSETLLIARSEVWTGENFC